MDASGTIGDIGTITITPIPPDGTIDPGSGKFLSDTPGIVLLAPTGDTTCKVTAIGAGTATISWQGTSNGVAITGDDTVDVDISPPQATAGHVAFSGFA
jgi:hypothetical protein